MTPVGNLSTSVARGDAALREGDWEAARSAFAAALAGEETPAALTGMAQSLWWLNDVEGAVDWYARAFAAFRSADEPESAARIALRLSREYHTVLDNRAAASGWFTRAQRLIDELPPGPALGWLELARADRVTDPATQERYAEAAFDHARRYADTDLEIYALARRGQARVVNGFVDEGIADLDEAMAAASSEATSIETVGETLCMVMLAAEVVGNGSRFEQWTAALDSYMARHHHLSLFGFCFTCCGEVFAINGDWEQAEQFFVTAIQTLEAAGRRSRCAHPAARFAQLRVRQGRLEEAEAMLAEYQDLPEVIEPLAAIRLARGEWGAARRILERRLAQTGEGNLLAVPFLAQLAIACVAGHDLDRAREAAERLHEVAGRSGLDRVRGLAELASGRIARADDDHNTAMAHFEKALRALEAAEAPMEAATTRLELARTLSGRDPAAAVSEAEAALQGFERLGASHAADQAAALLRDLGVGGRTGPKGLELLSRREREVLGLVARGLTNAEIAERLVISPKTAGNHVSNILARLGLRRRTEVAAYALRHLSGAPDSPNTP